MKFMFDWGSGTCVWSTNQAASEKYGYPVDVSRLPISSGLIRLLEDLCDKRDEALNWKCPNDDLLWSKEQCEMFFHAARNGYEKLCEELGTEYHIVFWSDCII